MADELVAVFSSLVAGIPTTRIPRGTRQLSTSLTNPHARRTFTLLHQIIIAWLWRHRLETNENILKNWSSKWAKIDIGVDLIQGRMGNFQKEDSDFGKDTILHAMPAVLYSTLKRQIMPILLLRPVLHTALADPDEVWTPHFNRKTWHFKWVFFENLFEKGRFLVEKWSSNPIWIRLGNRIVH